jgi:hypothetical protein
MSREMERRDSATRVRSARSDQPRISNGGACRDGRRSTRVLLASEQERSERSDISGVRSREASGSCPSLAMVFTPGFTLAGLQVTLSAKLDSCERRSPT